MKQLLLMLPLFSLSAHASLYMDYSRVYLEDIECLESKPSEKKIECNRIQNNNMMCGIEFDALLKNSGVVPLNITVYEEIEVDSKIFRPFTDKLNEFSAKMDAKVKVKKLIKEIRKIKNC